jgi:uncharacterized membrane protein (DUF373 family)
MFERNKSPSRPVKRYHDVSINSHEITMNTEQTLKLKALTLKATIQNQVGSDLVDNFIETHPNEMKKSLRNICAFITPELFGEVEQLCNNLSISKRQVVEMALIDFMKKANEVIAEVDPFEGLPTDPKGQPVGAEGQGE